MTGLAKLIKGLEEEYERATTYEIIDEVGLVDQFHDGYRTALIRCLTLAREELTQEIIHTEAHERYNSLLADYDQQHQKLQTMREEYEQAMSKLEEQKDHLKLLQNRCMGITFGKHCKTCAMINSCNAIVVMKKMTQDYGESAVHALFNYSEEEK